MKLKRLHRYLLSVLTGILLTIAFPYTGSLFPVAFIALVPLLLVENSLFKEGKAAKHVLLHSFIAFFGYNIGSNYWLYYSVTAGIVPVFAHAINAFFMASAFMVYHWTKRNFATKFGRFTPYSLLFIWVAFEYIHFNWELSTPWMTFGNMFSIAPEFVQWYSITGTLGGTFWIVLLNIFIFLFVTNHFSEEKNKKTQRNLGIAILLSLFVPAGTSYYTYSTYKEIHNPINVVVTQPNVEQYVERKTMYLKDQLDRLISVADTLITDSTHIVIGPETVIPNQYPVNENEYHLDTAFNYIQYHVNKWDGPALYLGLASFQEFKRKTRFSQRAYEREEKKGLYFEQYDASALIEKDSRPKFVHKSKLLLMAEKIPFSKTFPFLEDYAMDMRGTKGSLGGAYEDPDRLRTKGFNFSPVNCYETIYGEWVAKQTKMGSEIIFAISNDGWWGNTAGYKQHASFSRLRAIENRRTVVRSAMTGISCTINQRGDVANATEFGVIDGFRATVNLNKKQTFYSQYGDILGKSSTFLFYIVLTLNLFFWVLKLRKK